MIRCERHDCPASDCRVVAQLHQLRLPVGVLEERDHVGKALVGRAARWKADAALWIVLPRIRQRSPMLDRDLD